MNTADKLKADVEIPTATAMATNVDDPKVVYTMESMFRNQHVHLIIFK